MLYGVSALACEALAMGRDIMREISLALEALSAELIASQALNAALAARIEALEALSAWNETRLDLQGGWIMQTVNQIALLNDKAR